MSEAFVTPWKEYSDAVVRRLRSAQREYGDTALERPPMELARELQSELEDIAGWAVWLWWRLENFKKGLQKVQLELVRTERAAQAKKTRGRKSASVKRRRPKATDEEKSCGRKKPVHRG